MKSISFFVGIMWCASAWAGEPELAVRIDKQSVLLGDAVRLTVTVRNDSNPEKPEIGEVPGFDLRYRGVRQESFSSVTVVIQGKTVEQRKSGGGFYYDFDLIPKKSGVFEMDPIPVSYKNRLFSTDSFRIEVLEEAEKSDDVFLELTSDKSEIFLGESATVTLKWFFNKNVGHYEIRMPWLEASEGFVVSDPPQDPDRRYQKLLINGSQEVLVSKAMEIHKGREYAVVSFSKIVTPHRAGALPLDGAFLKGEAVTGYEGTGRSSFFDDFFGSDFNAFFAPQGRAVTEPFTARSEKLLLNVREVPKEGAPEEFTGAVGSFGWEAAVTPSRLKVGEPLTLKINVAGSGNIEEAVIPVPGDLEGFKGYEAESKFAADPETPGAGKRTIEKVWVARKPGVYVLPEIRWAFYDTAARAFRKLTVGPFEMTVDPAEEAGGEAGVPSAAAPSETAKPQALTPKPPENRPVEMLSRDIRYLKSESGTLKSQRGPRSNLSVIGALVFPLGILLLSAVVSEWRRGRIRGGAVRRAEARKGAQKFLTDAQAGFKSGDAARFYGSAEKALARYFSERWSLPLGATALELLEKIPERDLSERDQVDLKEFLTRAERALFSSTPAAEAVLSEDWERVRRVFGGWGMNP